MPFRFRTFFTGIGPAVLLLLLVASCTSKKEKLGKAIYNLEISDSSSSQKGMNQLADYYWEYARTFPEDTISMMYLYKGFMFKYLTQHYEDALSIANLFKKTYERTEMYQNIDIKLADIYMVHKHNTDSAIRLYKSVFGKIQMSTYDSRKAGEVLMDHVRKHPGHVQNAENMFYAGRFFQLCGDFKEAVSVFDSLASTYPAFTNAPDALMAAGFICWNNLNDLPRAKTYYTLLYQKYPEHTLGKEAGLILKEGILDMNEIELAEHLMKKNREKEKFETP